MRVAFALAVLVLLPRLAPAAGLTVLTEGKVASFKSGKGSVRVGRDPQLANAPSPLCPATSTVTLSSYPEPTQVIVVATEVELDCTKWKARKNGDFVYSDPDAAGGLASLRYGKKGIVARFTSAVPTGPVAYAQLWLAVGDTRFNARLHNFKKNGADAIVARKPSKAAAAGERAFWAILHRDWTTPDEKAGLEVTALAQLTKASKAKKDGWSHFLLAMTHLYRFGQMTGSYLGADETARAEIEAAHEIFAEAVPKVWDGSVGDTRVPGFAAATTFGLGVVRGDTALQDQGMAELDAAYALNPFFNIFDYLPVAQAVPSFDPRFQSVFTKVNDYLNRPGTLACLTTQPEICGNDGYAPRNTAGSLALFGDVNAKAGSKAGAVQWYGLALTLAKTGPTPYPFLDALQERVDTVDQRIALFTDDDASNDPFIIGAHGEACAACHNR